MVRTLFNIILFMSVVSTQGQTLNADGLQLDPSDISASTERRIDNEGKPCALIKIQVTDTVTQIKGCRTIGDIQRIGTTTWVYMPAGTESFTVLTLHHEPIAVTSSEPMKSLATYRLQLYDPNGPASAENPDNPTDAKDQYILAEDYMSSFGKKNYDIVKATEWYRASAEQGYAPAQYKLGKILCDWAGVDNWTEGVSWLQQAVDQGNVDAMLELARKLEMPPGKIAPDYNRMISLLERASNKGIGEASLKLGDMYSRQLYKDKVKQDKKKARAWYEKAVQQGDTTAKNRLRKL